MKNNFFNFEWIKNQLKKESFNIKLVFNSFKIKNYFSYEDSFLMIWKLS